MKTCVAKLNPDTTSDINDISMCKAEYICAVCDNMMHVHTGKWKAILASETGAMAYIGIKLRTYRLFKITYEHELYVTNNMPKGNRSAYAKFRCGLAHLRIDTGRYEQLALKQRVCFNCDNVVKDEEHVL
jgi:hypothetical protein